MKKSLILLLCLVFMSAFAFAAENDDVQVTWTVGTQSKTEIGFYDTADATEVSTGITLDDEMESVSGLQGKKDVYIKWDIVTNKPVTVSLYSDALKEQNKQEGEISESNTIDWVGTMTIDKTNVTTKVDSLTTSTIGNTSGGEDVYGSVSDPIELFTYDNSTDGMGDVGCIKLSIVTEDASSKTPTTYTTNLYVKISSDQG